MIICAVTTCTRKAAIKVVAKCSACGYQLALHYCVSDWEGVMSAKILCITAPGSVWKANCGGSRCITFSEPVAIDKPSADGLALYKNMLASL